MINKTISFLFLFILLFSFHASTSHAEQLVTTVDGTNVNLDWSAMPEAPSYTLYYTLADFKGDIDINTLGWIEMGNAKSLYVPGLPSGLIIFTAVVAHTSGGDVVSNIGQFMGFGGTVTFPETGNVLMNVDDPGGIGTARFVGTEVNGVPSEPLVHYTIDGGSGPFSVFVNENADISKYTNGNVEIRYLYEEDESFSYEFYENNVLLYSGSDLIAPVERSHVSSRARAVSGEQIDCGLWKEEYMQLFEQSDTVKNLKKDIEAMALMYLAQLQSLFGHHDFDFFSLLMMKGHLEKTIITLDDVRAQEASRYDNQCNDTSRPPEASGCGECSIPPGAQYESYVESDGEFTEDYLLNGHWAGPYMKWYDQARTRPQESRCYDENGKLHGTRCLWYENGLIRQNLYNHGVIVENILWFASGNLNQEKYYDNGEMVEMITYYDRPNALENHFRFKNGVQNGDQETWYENGNRNQTTNYVMGERIDTSFYSEEDGTREKVCTYENGLQQKCTPD